MGKAIKFIFVTKIDPGLKIDIRPLILASHAVKSYVLSG